MAYLVNFEPESIDDLDEISQVIRLRIFKKIEWLSVNFEKVSALPLTGQW
jgi:mRNA interferase RelE/StbE